MVYAHSMYDSCFGLIMSYSFATRHVSSKWGVRSDEGVWHLKRSGMFIQQRMLSCAAVRFSLVECVFLWWWGRSGVCWTRSELPSLPNAAYVLADDGRQPTGSGGLLDSEKKRAGPIGRPAAAHSLYRAGL